MSTTSQNRNTDIQHAANLLKSSKKTVILTGAGFSTPSGIPDFRTEGSGLWTRFLPMEVASLTVFRHTPERFYAWLRPLASHMLSAQPNAAHRVLALLQHAGYIHTIITQNIDGLHHRAGSDNVLEVHGTMNTLTCACCFHQYESHEFIEPYLNEGIIPRCRLCKEILKPDIILFEEQLPIKTWLMAEKASKTCELMLVAGSSLEVLPSARLPMYALENNASLIVVNKTETYIDCRAEVLFREDVIDILPQIQEQLLGDRS